MRCYLHLDPDALEEDEYAKIWGQLRFFLIQTGQMEAPATPMSFDDGEEYEE